MIIETTYEVVSFNYIFIYICVGKHLNFRGCCLSDMGIKESYNKLYIPLVAFCNKYLDDIEKSKNISQDCFVKLYVSKLEFDNLPSLRT